MPEELTLDIDFNAMILKVFDIKKMKRRCNFISCNRHPDKEVLIFEYSVGRRRDLVMLYVCAEHLKSVNEIIKKLRYRTRGVILEKSIKNLKEKAEK